MAVFAQRLMTAGGQFCSSDVMSEDQKEAS